MCRLPKMPKRAILALEPTGIGECRFGRLSALCETDTVSRYSRGVPAAKLIFTHKRLFPTRLTIKPWALHDEIPVSAILSIEV